VRPEGLRISPHSNMQKKLCKLIFNKLLIYVFLIMDGIKLGTVTGLRLGTGQKLAETRVPVVSVEMWEGG
jgi:hypothetical protein